MPLYGGPPPAGYFLSHERKYPKRMLRGHPAGSMRPYGPLSQAGLPPENPLGNEGPAACEKAVTLPARGAFVRISPYLCCRPYAVTNPPPSTDCAWTGKAFYRASSIAIRNPAKKAARSRTNSARSRSSSKAFNRAASSALNTFRSPVSWASAH